MHDKQCERTMYRMKCDCSERAALSRKSESAGSVSCHVECTTGDLGHCGRTQHEHLHHCEKLFNEGKPQRGEAKQNELNQVEQNNEETKA